MGVKCRTQGIAPLGDLAPIFSALQMLWPAMLSPVGANCRITGGFAPLGEITPLICFLVAPRICT
jgi:hypothetical protein